MRVATEQDLEGILRRLRKIEDRIDRGQPEVPFLRLPYAQRVLNPYPLASSGNASGDFAQASGIEIVAFRVSAFVNTTNNGANFWTLALVSTAGTTLASVTTSASAAATWLRLTDTTITQPLASNADIALVATATGAPGSIYIIPEVLAL